MIQASHLIRRAGDVTLLDDASLIINPGDSIGLAGPSGSGKSTLLRAIALLDPLDGGSVSFHGQLISGNNVPPYRRNVAYLAQRPCMIAGNVEQNLKLPYELGQASLPFDRRRASDLIAELGRAPSLLDQDATKLSGGEQQSVSIARAIQMDPQVLLLDEPTASLDQESTGKVENFLLAWKQADAARSWIWVSHDATQRKRMTTSTVQMKAGKLLP